MSSIEIQNLSKNYGEVTAVRDACFAAEQGSFVSLLGPSGCGKTTTLRMIAGFEDITSGDIKLGGKSIKGTPPWRRNIGVVFQSYALFPFMTVLQNICYGLKMRGVPKNEQLARARKVMEIVGLHEMENRYPRQLSGGQKQRVALARSIVIEPEILLLDEPLSALDAKMRDEMRFELKRIQRTSGVTTIFVTHDQEEAFALSDKIVVMNKSVVRQVGTPREIWEEPNSEFVAGFIGVENLLPCHIVAEDGRAFGQFGSHRLETDAKHIGKQGEFVLGIRSTDLVPLADNGQCGQNNTICGEVVGEVYTGEANIYQISSPMSDKPITVKTRRDHRLSGSVCLAVDPSKVMVLERG
ncbi:ABC transporter ATP-binding protein [Rhodobacteraceae bacterium RKSG542]|uniref:ABC transporter ATP-binding protein n=1 Tax=Pseudovibrio flavus TaxID=2529854 RepID=UPI0012BBD608|nr:ABC transporter ATP-binding protein [Pseudovibrio flavus]MTI16508.1 ABC transporter ATP-binding protein [Pseudovibrio flavus]